MAASVALRDVVAAHVESRWQEWAQAHPHLAAAIDRTRLTDTVVQRLRDQPAFIDAMRQADLDESQLAAAMRAIQQVDGVLRQIMR